MSGLQAYTEIEHIGNGSYGEVTLVRCNADHKKYVLKKIEVQNATDREKAMAVQEAHLMSTLRHPNVVTYKESFTAKNSLYICMGYCEGGDLHNRLKKQRGTLLAEEQVMEWTIQIALGLQYLHERNILHRDLKTQNIFLTKNKIIKVGDLGIARVLDHTEAMATTVIGTPYYMSPELFSNVPYNYKSDVWALGCIVFEMATLRQAFNAKDINALVYKVIRGQPSKIPSSFSADLNDLVMSMLDLEPDARPSVNRILKLEFVRGHMERYLQEAQKTRRSGSSRKSRARKTPKKEPKQDINSGNETRGDKIGAPLPETPPNLRHRVSKSGRDSTPFDRDMETATPIAQRPAAALPPGTGRSNSINGGNHSSTPSISSNLSSPKTKQPQTTPRTSVQSSCPPSEAESEMETPRASLSSESSESSCSTNPNRRARRKWREKQRQQPSSASKDEGLGTTILPGIRAAPVAGITDEFDIDTTDTDGSHDEGEESGDEPDPKTGKSQEDCDDASNDIEEDDDGSGDFGQYLGILGNTLRSPEQVGDWGSATPHKQPEYIGSPLSKTEDHGNGGGDCASVKTPATTGRRPVDDYVTPERPPPFGLTVGHAAQTPKYTPMRGPLMERSKVLMGQCRRHLSEAQLQESLKILRDEDLGEEEKDEALRKLLGSDLYDKVVNTLVEAAACDLAITRLNDIEEVFANPQSTPNPLAIKAEE